MSKELRLHCIDCVYEDIGFSGSQLCMPKEKSCQPVFSYDMQINSRLNIINKLDMQGASEQAKNKRTIKQYGN